MQAIVAATSRGAEYLRLRETGTLAAGKSADLLVLDGNPLEDITNTRRIAQIFLKGRVVDRGTLRAGLSSTR
jgi:imidazolonepropionase-like amidohydrolase